MTKPLRLLVLSVAALTVCSCSTFNKVTDKTLNIFRGKQKPADPEAVAEDAQPPAAQYHNAAVMYVDVNGSRRKVVIELDPSVAPKAVANFKKLVNAGFYNHLAFHRAIQGYLVQTGDPATRTDENRNSWGLSDVGYKLPPELRGKHVKGALAMARQGPLNASSKASSGSQFYVMLRSDTKLDGRYTVFGRVTQGIEALEAIAAMTVDTNDCPTRRYEIKSMRMVPSDSPELRPERNSRRKTRPDHEKGAFGRFFERIW
jgi:cyclophilin family peptidyl-prolyl cis-trans isomerase